MRCSARPAVAAGIVSHTGPFAVMRMLRFRQSFFVYCTESYTTNRSDMAIRSKYPFQGM